MNHFNKGDVVVRTAGEWRGVKQGDINVVESTNGGGIIYLVGFDGYAFDPDNFELADQQTTAVLGGFTPEIEVGSLVRMISRSPRHGAGLINIGDEGTVISLDEDGDGYRVKFPRHPTWHSGPDDCELVNKTPVPAVSIDEAVEACKTARTEIEELEAKVKALKDSIKVYEVVLQRAGLKFI
ncbi:hypothetical protein QGX11_gp082 [Pseudomonas phage PPSC2]|uniref:Uncharacterized protein n=1 Tax=Pseudomonas phage PPSC2 TaxID=2041350 RepID=A0A2R2YAQ3_9CAUD|nr:hypothetical protein QGX11_gp082 [Pseudomonas phage PPSC2]ATN92845.1 hypothetical protein PPSC2_82 [Pseudomonas phage PPSC2]